MMTSAQVVETSVNVISNSPSQDYTHLNDHNLPNYDSIYSGPWQVAKQSKSPSHFAEAVFFKIEFTSS